MDNKEVKDKQSNLFALECLATTAGQLHKSEKLMKPKYEDTNKLTSSAGSGEMSDKISSNKVPVVQMAPMSSTETTSSLLPSMNMGNFYPPPFPPTPPNSMRPFADFTFPPPFSHSPFRNFMDMPPASFGMKMDDMPWRTGLPPVIPSTRESNGKGSPALSSDTEKSAFDIVHKRNSVSPNSTSSFDTNLTAFATSDVLNNAASGMSQEPPQQPPLLFRIDQPPSNNSLLETLVQESQKILSGQDEESTNAAVKNSENKGSKKDAKQAKKTNNDFKRAREMVLISPQKKTRKRSGLHSVSDVKRAYGGPPFKPGYTPPALNTAESAMCCFYEHTLLKMATRGFWSGDRGPLQDVFRLSRVENSDLQYDMRAVTKHCYNVVKQKLENADGDKPMMYKHMRNYVDEFDSYLERIYPVSSMAINLYLPTASDYNIATWHGIVPTGWSEYRRAVVIREVFELLFNISSTESETIPEYKSYFFCKPGTDKALLPLPLETPKKKKTSDSEHSLEEGLESDVKDQNNNGGIDLDSGEAREFNLSEVKYSRAFEALWTRTAPHEPYVILEDESKTSLREYFEKFPIEVYAPPDETLIVVDDKKYKARNILGFFRRGVQLVDYSKETGSMVIDTISTIRNVSATSAVRKIPPGRISKLVHPELHLENYTNTITQVGASNADGSPIEVPVKPKIRRRRIKHRNSDGVNVKEEKVKKRRTKHTNSHSFDNDYKHASPFVTTDPFLTPNPPVVEKLASIESICNAMKIEGGGSPLKIEGVDDKQFPNLLTTSTSSVPSISSHYPVFTPPPIQRVSSAESPKCLSEIRTPQRSESGGSGCYSVESLLPKENDKSSNRSRDPRESMLDAYKFSTNDTNGYRVNQYTQTIYDTPPQSKNDAILTPNLFSPDILSPFTSHLRQHQANSQSPLNLPPYPPGPPDQQMFSLHLMIDSYRRAAKYLLDTANHLELVARHGNHGNSATPNKKQPPSSNDVTKKEDD